MSLFEFKPLSTLDIILSIPIVVYVLKHVLRYLWYFPERCTAKKRFDGKTVMVTGGSSYGIGWALAREFARRGAKVVVTGRDFDETQVACNRIRCTTWSNGLYVNLQEMKLDLTSGKAIRKFVNDFRKENKNLDILVNCAGALAIDEQSRELTPEGLEKTMATNYFGHFLLTNLLLDDLHATGSETRVINVVDGEKIKELDSIDLDNLNSERGYDPESAYARAKLNMVLFTKELDRRIGEWNEGKNEKDRLKVDVNCVDPGKADTELYRNKMKKTFFKVKHSIIKHFYRTPHQASRVLMQLCADDQLAGVSGEYWENAKQTEAPAITQSAKLAEELWNRSVKLTGLTPAENFFIDTPKPAREAPKEEEEEEEAQPSDHDDD